MILPFVNTETRTVVIKKQKWPGNELLLAQCFGYAHDELTGEIRINLNHSSRAATHNFLKTAYQGVIDNIHYSEHWKEIFSDVKTCYQNRNWDFYQSLKSKVPYFEKIMNRPGQKFPYQYQDLVEMYPRQHNLLAYDMRTGKTIMATTLSLLDKTSVTLVVCPGVAKFTSWFNDLTEQWGFDPSHFTIYDSKKKNCRKAFDERFIVVNYEMLHSVMDEILKKSIKHIIVDEIHRVKETTTRSFKKLKEVVSHFPSARFTGLSGTPIANRVDDMFAYFNLLNHPLGVSKTHFLKTYCIMYNSKGGKKVGKAKNHEDLSVKLSNFMIRRTQQECFDIMPKQIVKHMVDSGDFREEYDRMIEEVSLQKNHAALNGHIMAINNLTSMVKVSEAISICQEVIEYEKKVVIFCSFTAPLRELEKQLAEMGIGTVTIDGSVDMAERGDIVKRFHEDPECKVFLGNMKAAGEGVDLSAASDIIFLNYAFTPKDMEQPAERCTSMKKLDKIVTIHYLMAQDSIDVILHDIVVDKKMDINAIIDKGKGSSVLESTGEAIFRRLTGKNFEIEKKEILNQ